MATQALKSIVRARPDRADPRQSVASQPSARIGGLTRASVAALIVMAGAIGTACTESAEQPEGLMSAAYDPETGRLRLIEYDSDENGIVDTWTYMEGSRLLRIEIDRDEDGRMERWEYYDENHRLEKVGLSSEADGVVDMWAYEGADGQLARIEVSTGRDGTVDRWQYYERDVIVRAEQDTTGDGIVDRWETFEDGRFITLSFDQNGDGRPDRRLTYNAAAELVSIETDPDENGVFTTMTPVPDGER